MGIRLFHSREEKLFPDIDLTARLRRQDLGFCRLIFAMRPFPPGFLPARPAFPPRSVPFPPEFSASPDLSARLIFSASSPFPLPAVSGGRAGPEKRKENPSGLSPVGSGAEKFGRAV